jgi:outer membrane protein insertion porin family
MIRKTRFYNACIWAPFTALLLAIALVIPPAEGAESLTRIAVLPFEIHTLKPMDYLAEGLQAMMTQRLAREGFDVMDPAAINESELSKTPLSNVDLLRKVGRDNNIDWLIGGSLTQIGEKMSVDLTIVPTSGERRSFSAFAVGDGVDTLVQVIEQLAGTAKNRITGVAQIESLSVRGNKRIETDAILAAVESQKGMIFDPEALNKDLRSIYEMGFFEDVEIDVEDGPGGKIVTFKVREKPSIGKIAFEGNKEIDKEDLEKVFGIKKYAILDRAAIKDSVKRLRDYYHQEGYQC